jgi:hypothetical protein
VIGRRNQLGRKVVAMMQTAELHAEGPYRFHRFYTECCVSVENQVARRRIEGERLAQLLRAPGTCRIPGNIEVKDSPPVMCDDEEAIQYAEGQRGHGEEIHRRDGFTVVAEESRPSFRRFGAPRRFAHPVQYGSLGDLETKHLELAMNARCTPRRVLDNHAKDQVAQLPGRRPPATPNPLSGYPFPVEPESCTMPADDCVRLDDEKNATPIGPDSPHHHPERFIKDSESRLPILPSQGSKLLPQGKIF